MPKPPRSIQNRHRARELAVQLLYSLGIRPEQDLDKCIEVFLSEDGFAFEEVPAVKEYLAFLVRGTWTRRRGIDETMRELVTGWRPERMVAVDRAVLRLAIFEGSVEKKVPLPVAISEAVELARVFGTEDSGKFVNGVLAKVARLEGENASGEERGNAASFSAVSTDR
ncbi:MAG: transcription antitermination factor NusB [Synergistaceae bacterium]|nr:transcription antitermination factor NusB [Synergistaceae bacterium]